MRVLLPVVPLTDNYLGIFYTRNVSHRTLYGGQFPFINSVDKWKSRFINESIIMMKKL